MNYLENDDSMPAFIRDIKAYAKLQSNYHSQHSSEIRRLRIENESLAKRIEQLEKDMYSLKGQV